MFCILCKNFSTSIICKKCQNLLQPTIKKRDDIVSFYSYENIELLLKY